MTTSGRILALDLALTVGWAAASLAEWRPLAPMGAPASWEPMGGALDLRRFRQYQADNGSVFLGFRKWLFDEIAQIGASILILEAPLMHLNRQNSGSSYSMRLALGLAAHAECIAREFDMPIFEKAPASIKKHATGDGRAKKPAMVAAAKARGWKVVDDNHADALHLLDYALHVFAKERAA